MEIVNTKNADFYTDAFCESVKIIGESLLEGLAFDKTIVCIITDDSKREFGTYTVSDGSVSFIAYSENTSYRNNSEVYVTIPNGDYDNNKIITGKKKKNDSIEPFIYTSPFSTVVDVSGNLITSSNNCGLVANAPAIYYEAAYNVDKNNYMSYYIRNEETSTYSKPTGDYDDNAQYYIQHRDGINKVIFEREYENPYYGFTRLGIQAQFQAWLQEYNCISGNYGLKLTVQFVPESSVSQELNEPMTRVMYLETTDMIGDPYAFESYYNQEKVFDISGFGGLKYVKLEFFQETGSFYTREGRLLPYLNNFNDEILFSNLFVKDCRVCVGYEIGSYNTEFVQLSSFSAKTYTSKVDTSKNEKKLSLKWIHIDDEGHQIQVDSSSPYEYEIRWYRYSLGEPSADNYCGPGWTDPIHERNIDTFKISEDKYSATLQPDVSLKDVEQVKVIILFGPAPGYTQVQSLSEADYEENPAKYYIYENNQYINCQGRDYESRNYYTQNEDSRKIFRSNIVEFKNENSVINSATLDAIQALTLVCQDEIDDKRYDTYGNYLLYDQSNRLIDGGQAHIKRIIGCKFNLSATSGDDTQALKDSSITWRFPLNNTMISCTMKDANGNSLVRDEASADGQATGYGLVTFTKGADCWDNTADMPIFTYTISSIYSPSKFNNFIECIVSKDGVNYHAVKELSFGQSGTAGTDWTFAIDFDQTFNAILLGETNVEYSVTASLYDNAGRLMDISDKEIEWNFIEPTDSSKDLINPNNAKLELQTIDNKSYRRKIILKNNLTIDDLIILKATIKDWGDYQLTAFLPIPIRASSDYLYLTGATQIIYLTDGNPLYYNKYYEMHGIKDGKTSDLTSGLTFEPVYGDPAIKGTGGIRYMPEVSKQTSKDGTILGYKLKPVSMYTDNLPIFGVQVKKGSTIVWTQPVLIIQNRYPAAMINKWNGKDLVLDEENSAIISNMIGAGSKNNQNQFTGVLMGDWRGKIAADTDASLKTGLFGFRDGQMSFSFTDDGKAAIGTATGAQLVFDGTESTVTSRSFSTGTGMQLDFDDSIIEAKADNKTIFRLSTSSPYLTINNNNNNTLMSVGSSGYYLQSATTHFTELTSSNRAAGMKIDLNSGSITATTGSFYGDLNVYPSDGSNFSYTTYYQSGKNVYANSTKATLSSINLATIITELKSNISYATAAASAAGYAADRAETVAERAEWAAERAEWAAENAQDGVEALSRIVTIQNNGYGYLDCYNGEGTGSSGHGIAIVGRNGNVAANSNGAHMEGGSYSLWVTDSGVGTDDADFGSSDRRLKHDINYLIDKSSREPYKNIIKNLKFSTFKFNKRPNQECFGLIAQDVQESMEKLGFNPWLLVRPSGADGQEDMLMLSYSTLSTISVMAMQDLMQENEQLKQELREIKEVLYDHLGV